MTPTLNWREISALAKSADVVLPGLFVDRVFIPERRQSPMGYLKGEWAIGFSGKRTLTLMINPRAAHPYVYVSYQKPIKTAIQATRSPFDLALHKYLQGSKLISVEALDRDRVLLFWFSSGKQQQLGLVLFLIPARPEAFLVERQSKEDLGPWPVIASRRNPGVLPRTDHFSLPARRKAPDDLPFHDEWFKTPEALEQLTEKELESECFDARLKVCEKEIRTRLKAVSTRLRQSQTALTEAERESDWQRLGDLLKASLSSNPKLVDGFREVTDFVTDTKINIPCDPKLDLKDQVQKFFSLAKRKSRRITEVRLRFEDFKTEASHLEKLLVSFPPPLDWQALEKFEPSIGITRITSDGSKREKRPAAEHGKLVLSKDGLRISVGRSKDENLLLTFKQARGNDLWFHIRGKPGSHVIVQVPSGKSAPLETLLDAATLAVYYSGGEKWGKTEVDYTFKKHVKRIKDSSEASYSHNKTLMIEMDPIRLKRLIGERK